VRAVLRPWRHAIALSALLFGLAASALVMTPLPHERPQPRAQAHHSHARPPAKLVRHKQVVPPPVKESQFALEARMTPRQRMNRWNALIVQAAQRFHVPAPWIRAVLAAESAGRTMSTESLPLTSRAGALGLMQLMPQTYDEMRALYGLGTDPHDPHDNIFAGTAYLRQLFLAYGYPTMFSAYNDGPGNLEDKLRNGGLLPLETRNYAARVSRAVESGVGLHGIAVKFTRPDGAPVWIDAAAVISVRAALDGEYAPGVRTVITVGRSRQGVCEALGRVRALLHMRGG